MSRQDHLGRLIDHVHLVVSDFVASRRFYAAILDALGREFSWEGDEAFACDELFFGAFVLDPDGNNLEAVHHGRGRRSAESVVIESE